MKQSFRNRGGWWVVGQSILMLAVVVLGGIGGGRWGTVVTFGLGCVLFAASAFFGIWGAISLGRNRTAYPAPLEGGHLVETGPYAVVRHPLYASVILGSWGWGLLLSSGPALLAAVVLTGFFYAKAGHEEQLLRRTYRGYDEYAKRVRRLIPWVW